jgi:LSD1 subclass zinc finger protein
MRRTTTLESVPCLPDGGTLARYDDVYTGQSTHRLKCGGCGHAIATGVDPYLYPAMFEGASHIECSRCSSINALPIDV